MTSKLLQMMKKRAEGARKEESAWINPDSVSVDGLVVGFVDMHGRVFNRKDQAVVKKFTKIRLLVTDTKNVKEKEGEIRRQQDNPGGIEVKMKIGVGNAAAAWIRGGEDAAKQAKADKDAENVMLSKMTSEDKKNYHIKKNEEKKTPEQTKWIPVTPGLVIDVNIFNPSDIAGMEGGVGVSIDGLSAKGSVYLQEPNTGFYNSGYEIKFTVFWSFRKLSFRKQHTSLADVYETIPAYSDITPYPILFDLKLDLTREGDEEECIYSLDALEFPRYVRIPLKMEFDQPPDETSKTLGIVSALTPSDGADDFRGEKRQTDEERKQNALANQNQNIEDEESHYICLMSRVTVIKYQKDPESELDAGTTLVSNVVVKICSNTLMKELGITRERLYTPIMGAIAQSLEWEVIGCFSSSSTTGNRYNITNDPQQSGCWGNIIFREKTAVCRFREFLLESAFHPSQKFVEKHYKQYMKLLQGDVGFLDLKTTNPYVSPNPMLQKYKGGAVTNKDIVPFFLYTRDCAGLF